MLPSKKQQKKKTSKGQRSRQVIAASKDMPDLQPHGYMAVIPKNIGWAFPRLRANLRFHKWININSAGVQAANVRFSPTFAYDVDPTVASTSMPGFTEYGSMYRLYRVNKATLSCEFANTEAFTVTCYSCPVNQDPGANYNSTNAQTYLSQRNSKSACVGPLTGNGIATIKDSQSTAEFGGARNLQVIDNYCGSTSGGVVPSNNWWWTVGILSLNNFITGVNANVVIDVEVEFFELLSPSA